MFAAGFENIYRYVGDQQPLDPWRNEKIKTEAVVSYSRARIHGRSSVRLS